MLTSETQHLLDLWANNICPWCSKNITDDERIGTGRKSDGGFCSLDCYVKYYSAELDERTQRIVDNDNAPVVH